jgi:hypothetical protein
MRDGGQLFEEKWPRRRVEPRPISSAAQTWARSPRSAESQQGLKLRRMALISGFAGESRLYRRAYKSGHGPCAERIRAPRLSVRNATSCCAVRRVTNREIGNAQRQFHAHGHTRRDCTAWKFREAPNCTLLVRQIR